MHHKNPTPTTLAKDYSKKLDIINAANNKLKADLAAAGQTSHSTEEVKEAKPSLLSNTTSTTPLTSSTSSSLFAAADTLFADARSPSVSLDTLDIRQAKDSVEYKAYLPLFQIGVEFEKHCKKALAELNKSTSKEASMARENYNLVSTQLRNAIFRLEKPYIGTYLSVENQLYSDAKMQRAHIHCYADGLNKFQAELTNPHSDLSRALWMANTILVNINNAFKLPTVNLIDKCEGILNQYTQNQQALLSTQNRR